MKKYSAYDLTEAYTESLSFYSHRAGFAYTTQAPRHKKARQLSLPGFPDFPKKII
jgi:hypothetical protein